jgi:3',5'-cyclic AMP phosphodiesterase CpdA
MWVGVECGPYTASIRIAAIGSGLIPFVGCRSLLSRHLLLADSRWVMKFVQITDLHLVPDGEELLGFNPLERLSACIADINRHREGVSFCVFTGDLTDRGDRQAYGVLRECLEMLELPYHLMLGNHDRRAAFFDTFPHAPRDENGFVQFQLETEAGRLIFLDTLDEGRSAGLYCDQRRAWLSRRLQEANPDPVYLFMHHPPFDIGIPSLDRIKLDDTHAFATVLRESADIRHLFLGHVHRPVSGSWQGIPFSALPGTNHQIAADFESVSPIPYEHSPSAYGIVHLDAEQTTVHTKLMN